MKLDLKPQPRSFQVGRDNAITIHDMGDIRLEPNEQVTFVTASGKRHDFACKDWGFYATPSVNGRLKAEGFRTALVRNEAGRVFVMVVDEACMEAFETYCRDDRQTVLQWLDEM